MSHQAFSLTPSRCYWCDIGRISNKKCMTCGATFGFIKKEKKNPVVGKFDLPQMSDFRRKTFKELTQ